MEVALREMLLSNKSDAKKRSFVNDVVLARENTLQLTRQKFTSMMDCCLDIIVKDEASLSFHLASSIFSELAESNLQLFLEYFDSRMVVFLMQTNTFNYPEDAVWILNRGLSILRQCHQVCYDRLCQAVNVYAVNFARTKSSGFDVIIKFCELLVDHQKCIPSDPVPLCLVLISATTKWAHVSTNMESFVHAVRSYVGTLLKLIWNNNAMAARASANEIFGLIFEHTGNSVALGCVVQFMPDSAMRDRIYEIAKSQSLEDEVFVNALCHMTDWLLLPLNDNIDRWSVLFIRHLAQEQRLKVLMRVAELQTLKIFKGLKQESVRNQCFTVLAHLLLGYQRYPRVFHQILPAIPETVRALQLEIGSGRNSSGLVLLRLAELVYCLMDHHLGYQGQYTAAIASLKNYRKPSKAEMEKMLADHSWSSASASIYVGKSAESDRPKTATNRSPDNEDQDWEEFDIEDEVKSATGLTGLTNLGNTCYMNSVLQCLFMCDYFRQKILCSSSADAQTILAGLQRVFAFLMMSKRPACSPEQFFKDAKPPWFKADLQHDCSEFLRHLLDQLHEQELAVEQVPRTADSNPNVSGKTIKKNSSTGWLFRKILKWNKSSTAWDVTSFSSSSTVTLADEIFGGRIVSTCVCLHCRSESSKSESFTDLTLAFPDDVPKVTSSTNASLPSARVAANGIADHNENFCRAVDGGAKTVFLQTMFEQFLKPEQLDGTNRYRCDRCECLRNGERRVAITNAPSCLVLTLVRFAYNAKTGRNEKVFTNVDYPLTLFVPVVADSSSTLKKSSGITTSSSQFVQYGLCGVIVHAGTSSDGGHYYSYARHCRVRKSVVPSSKSFPTDVMVAGCDSDSFDDEWFLFNDERVSPSTFSEIRGLTMAYPKDTAYVLFYKRVDDQLPGVKVGSHERSLASSEQLRPDLISVVEEDNAAYQKSLEKKDKKKKIRGTHLPSQAVHVDNYKSPSNYSYTMHR